MENKFKLIKILRGHSNVIFRSSWSLDGNYIASPSKDKTVIIHALNDDLCKIANVPNEPNCVSWLSNETLVVGLDGGILLFWDSNKGDKAVFKFRKNGDINTLSLHPRDNIIAVGTDDHTVYLFDLTTKHIIDQFTFHKHWVISCDWSMNGSFLAIASRDESISIINYKTSKKTQLLSKHNADVNCVRWHPKIENVLISCSNDKTVKIWNSETGELIRDHIDFKGRVNSVSFSFDGELYATKSQDNTIRIYHYLSGGIVNEFKELSSNWVFPSINFHPTQKILATLGEEDTIIRLWSYSDLINLETINGQATLQIVDEKAELIKTLENGNLSLVIDKLRIKYQTDEFTFNQIILITRRYNLLAHRSAAGTLTNEEIRIETMQISEALLNLVNQITP